MMRMKSCISIVVLALAIALNGCGAGSMTKQDIVNKTSNVKTKQELEKALGKPTNFNKLGPLETWTYQAKDGEVNYVITGDTVQLQATSDNKPKQ
jgi:hypothetical protein